jgi:hypothetical protein
MHRFARWKALIEIAADEASVYRIMAEYVDVLLPSETTALPPLCQKILSNPLLDIPGAAFDLVQEELRFRGDAEIVDILHEITLTFVAASARLAQLQARQHGLGGAPEPH